MDDQQPMMHDVVAVCERELERVESERDLERLLCTCFGVDGSVPGYEAHSMRLGGLTVHPGKLAACLWAVRDRLRASRVRSFLHVGTGHGHTFVALCLLLWKYVNTDMAVHTIDEHNYVLTDVLPIVRPRRSIVPSLAAWAERCHHELVFVEGGTERDAAKFARPGRVCLHGTIDGCRILTR